jgi:hypothetical protein
MIVVFQCRSGFVGFYQPDIHIDTSSLAQAALKDSGLKTDAMHYDF